VQLTGTVGIYDQPTQVTDDTSTEDPILGVPSGFKPNEALASPREDQQHNTDVPEPEETTTSHSPSTVPVAGENDSSCTSSSFSPYTVQTPAATENTVLEAFQIVQPDRLPEQGVNEQTSLMAWNGRDIIQPPPDRTDASLIGWGAVCEVVQTGGL